MSSHYMSRKLLILTKYLPRLQLAERCAKQLLVAKSADEVKNLLLILLNFLFAYVSNDSKIFFC